MGRVTRRSIFRGLLGAAAAPVVAKVGQASEAQLMERYPAFIVTPKSTEAPREMRYLPLPQLKHEWCTRVYDGPPLPANPYIR